MLVPRTGSRRLALLRTRAAVLRAPAAATAETIGIPYVSLIPAEVRKPLGSARVFTIPFNIRNALRCTPKEAAGSHGYLQKNSAQKSAEYRDSLDLLVIHK